MWLYLCLLLSVSQTLAWMYQYRQLKLKCQVLQYVNRRLEWQQKSTNQALLKSQKDLALAQVKAEQFEYLHSLQKETAEAQESERAMALEWDLQ